MVYTKTRHVTVEKASEIVREMEESQITVIKESKTSANHTLVQMLISNFQHQRSLEYMYQFAVLFLSSDMVIKFRVRDHNGAICVPPRATDNRYSIFPPDYHLYNYLTARPTGRLGYLHAEAQLMDKFQVLLGSYQLSNRHGYTFLVLFTWLLPCWHCAERITTTLRGDSPKVSLFYISKMQGVSDEEERMIVAYLEGAGLKVIRETNDEVLLPAGQY